MFQRVYKVFNGIIWVGRKGMIEAYHFVTFSKCSFDTSMPSLVSLTQSSPQIFEKNQAGVFTISEFPVKSFLNTICHNSRTCTGNTVKRRPPSKLQKRITVLSERLMQRHFLLMLSLINLGYNHEVSWKSVTKFWHSGYGLFVKVLLNMLNSLVISRAVFSNCYALCNLVPFMQFQKHEKNPWRSFTFSKVAD